MKPLQINIFLVVVAVIILLAVPFFGPVDIPLSAIFKPESADTTSMIFWQIRFPRVLTALLAGSALAVSGMAFQAMFRNPLATPFTLGVSSGASLGAVLWMRTGIVFSLGFISGTAMAAFTGAVFSVVSVYGLVRIRGRLAVDRLLLAGVAMSFFFSSLIMFVHFTSNLHDTFRLMRWLMGSLAGTGYASVIQIAPFAVSGIIVFFFLRHDLNLLIAGDDIAQSRGVNVQRIRHIIFFMTSLMVGSVVAACGPIGFIGLMVPHMCRLMTGINHKYLLPASIVFGGTFLAVCDAVARTAAVPVEIPVGVITALLGGPFFIWLLLGKSTKNITW